MGPSSSDHIRVTDATHHPTIDSMICNPVLTDDAIRLYSPLYVNEPTCGQLALSWHGIEYIKVFGAQMTLVSRGGRLLHLTITGDGPDSPGLDFARQLFAQKHLKPLEPSELLFYLAPRQAFWIGKSFATLSSLRTPVYLINSKYRRHGAGPWSTGGRQAVVNTVVHDLIRHYQSNVAQMKESLAADGVTTLEGDRSLGVIFLYEAMLKKKQRDEELAAEEAASPVPRYAPFSIRRCSPPGSPSL